MDITHNRESKSPVHPDPSPNLCLDSLDCSSAFIAVRVGRGGSSWSIERRRIALCHVLLFFFSHLHTSNHLHRFGLASCSRLSFPTSQLFLGFPSISTRPASDSCEPSVAGPGLPLLTQTLIHLCHHDLNLKTFSLERGGPPVSSLGGHKGGNSQGGPTTP